MVWFGFVDGDEDKSRQQEYMQGSISRWIEMNVGVSVAKDQLSLSVSGMMTPMPGSS